MNTTLPPEILYNIFDHMSEFDFCRHALWIEDEAYIQRRLLRTYGSTWVDCPEISILRPGYAYTKLSALRGSSLLSYSIDRSVLWRAIGFGSDNFALDLIISLCQELNSTFLSQLDLFDSDCSGYCKYLPSLVIIQKVVTEAVRRSASNKMFMKAVVQHLLFDDVTHVLWSPTDEMEKHTTFVNRMIGLLDLPLVDVLLMFGGWIPLTRFVSPITDGKRILLHTQTLPHRPTMATMVWTHRPCASPWRDNMPPPLFQYQSVSVTFEAEDAVVEAWTLQPPPARTGTRKYPPWRKWTLRKIWRETGDEVTTCKDFRVP